MVLRTASDGNHCPVQRILGERRHRADQFKGTVTGCGTVLGAFMRMVELACMLGHIKRSYGEVATAVYVLAFVSNTQST